MSSLKTLYHKFNKWVGVDYFKRIEHNENLDLIDEKLGDFNILPTTEKTNLAAAIKEQSDTVNTKFDNVTSAVNTRFNDISSSIKEHTDSNNVHGAVSGAIPGKIIIRDINGRAKVAAPVEADDIARKQEIDAVNSRVDLIISTPAEGVSAQEIIDARGGKTVLGQRLNDIDAQLADMKAEKFTLVDDVLEIKSNTVTINDEILEVL